MSSPSLVLWIFPALLVTVVEELPMFWELRAIVPDTAPTFNKKLTSTSSRPQFAESLLKLVDQFC